MCGIAGLVTLGKQQPEAGRLEKMLAALAHRGPDEEGVFKNPHLQMGMRRLSVIDPMGGNQPLYNEDRSLALIANGEIYNFVELRAELQSQGHAFATGSDCETILHLYEEHGLRCVDYLRGMFAFALWDNRENRLLLARDRIGEKPLYLYESDGELLFASELKALLASGRISKKLAPEALELYLHYQYVPQPLTLLQEVCKLPPAHLLILEPESGRRELRQYWSMTEIPAVTGDPTPAIRSELQEIGRLIIRSDVPIGIALSGGIDSSLVAALAVRECPQELQAFCVGYPGRPEYDERSQAHAFAEKLHLPFHELELRQEEIIDGFPGFVARLDEPIADIAAFGHYAVMRAARDNGVKVMLCGLGGDELFWGYPWVVEGMRLTERKLDLLMQNKVPWWATSSALAALSNSSILQRLCKSERLPKLFRNKLEKLAEWAALGLDYPGEAVFYNRHSPFNSVWQQRRELYHPEFLAALPARGPQAFYQMPETTLEELPGEICQMLFATWLSGNCLPISDRLSMAASVEGRLPLLDYRLIELVMGLRKAGSDHGLEPKAWLKAAAREVLPAELLTRPKRGFQPPSMEWIAALLKTYGDRLLDGQVLGMQFLRKKYILGLLEEFRRSGRHALLLYKLLLLEMWVREVLAGDVN
ncbi:MAG: asparagine synthase (glutamine-hydrolyzing) [Planctomycetes bacterium]|nr:asparagine synthase (glutamine-hydrolyzing) [Planctomycetota bacterium]